MMFWHSENITILNQHLISESYSDLDSHLLDFFFWNKIEKEPNWTPFLGGGQYLGSLKVGPSWLTAPSCFKKTYPPPPLNSTKYPCHTCAGGMKKYAHTTTQKDVPLNILINHFHLYNHRLLHSSKGGRRHLPSHILIPLPLTSLTFFCFDSKHPVLPLPTLSLSPFIYR